MGNTTRNFGVEVLSSHENIGKIAQRCKQTQNTPIKANAEGINSCFRQDNIEN
jgi:hypothetical protein